MKNIFFIRAGLFFLIFQVFVIIQAPSNAVVSAAYGAETTAAISCKDKKSIFQSSMFARLNRDMSGSVSGFEIHLSYENGTCSSLLCATSDAESHIGSGYYEDNDDLVFALR